MLNVQNLYYLGPDGSNSHSAVIKFLNLNLVKAENKIPQKSIKSAIYALEQDKNAIAVLPIENSIEGLVRETIDNMLKIKDTEIKIQGETFITVQHMLLSKTSDTAKIKKIYSHPQAFAQCSSYLYDNFRTAELKEVSSTSYAAQKAAEENDETIAAIANRTCADIFGLNIAASDINDEKDNRTRFYVFGREPLKSNGLNKTSIIVSPSVNKAGVLYNILGVLFKYGINLSYIDSRPSKKHLGEYLFFMEFDGAKSRQNIKEAMEELKQLTDFFKLLGSFSVYS